MTETETYRIEIQASNHDGSIWQTMSVDRVPRKILLADVQPIDEFALSSGEIPAKGGTVWEPYNASEGIGGLPRIMYRAYQLVSTQDLAEDTAHDQDIATGDAWRVRVYVGDDETHVAEAGPAAEGMSVGELARRVTELAGLPPLDRAAAAKTLADDARVVLARIRRATVYETTRAMPWDDVAQALGVSGAAINQLITAHRARI